MKIQMQTVSVVKKGNRRTGLCDQLGIANVVTRAGVRDLKAILILETGWMELPWPEMQPLGKKASFLGKIVNSVFFFLNLR